jgi:ring-1,2-phenylacetyl-CoA epoxidase subunit PaaE
MSLRVDQLAKPLKVARRIQETLDAVSLVLEIPPEFKVQFHYQAGQFVTFFMTLQGELLSRSYSLSSSPLVDQEFKVTIKHVPGGRGSGYLCEHVKAGDTLMTTPPSGHFFKPSLEPKGLHYFLFAAGSGITPVYSIMKTVLAASGLNHVTLVFCNRNQGSIIYKNELDEWAKKYPSRLDVVHVLSKPADGWPGRSGRIDRGMIVDLLKMPASGPSAREYYLCGPLEFMHLVRNTLGELGVAKDQIKEENFGLTVHKPQVNLPDHWTYIGPDVDKAAEGPEKIIAQINGERVEVAAQQGRSILETLLESGAQPPYSCMDGACMACLGKIQEGRVYQEDPGILTDDNVANCEALTCQAKPLSKVVKVSYDDL